jgi:hypothetical protein
LIEHSHTRCVVKAVFIDHYGEGSEGQDCNHI